MLGAEGTVTLWKGGCKRVDNLVFRSTEANARITLTSDESVPDGGFDMYFKVDGVPPDIDFIPCPGPDICWKHERCAGTVGVCTCNLGYTGEDCSKHILCCNDPAVCTDCVCDLDPANVITVAPDGDDTYGTGQMMNVSDYNTAHKAVATLTKAFELAEKDGTVFVYPGEYVGGTNCDVAVNKEVTIQRFKGSKYTIIDCEDAQCTITLTDFDSTIEGLQFRRASANSGGALNIIQSTPTFIDVQVNNATSDIGGGIYAQDSTITMGNSKISYSSATNRGGGTHLQDSSLDMTLSYIDDCSADTGGGLSMTGVDASIRTNSATKGGDIGSADTATISGLLLHNNGGIYAESGTHIISSSTIDTNTATTGGGLTLGATTSASLSISAVKQNTAATGDGDGLYNIETNLAVSLDTFVLEENDANRSGGALLNNCDVTLSDATMTFASGGGMYIYQGRPMILTASIESSSASTDGGGLTLESSTSNLVINDNEAVQGGGLHLTSSVVTGSSISVTSNRATEVGGGLYGTGQLALDHITIDACTSVVDGGGAYTTESTNEFDTCDITKSNAVRGGGIFMTSTTVTWTSSLVADCIATHSSCVYADTSSITGGDYSGNAATYGESFALVGSISLTDVTAHSSTAVYGAGMYSIDATLALSSCTIWDNTASDSGDAFGYGGGIYFDATTTTHLTLSITDNAADYGGGLALAETSFVPLDSETLSVTSNKATRNGGNAYITGASTPNKAELQDGQVAYGGGIAFINGATASLNGVWIELGHNGFTWMVLQVLPFTMLLYAIILLLIVLA